MILRFFLPLLLAMAFVVAGCSSLKKTPAEPLPPLTLELEMPNPQIAAISDPVTLAIVFRNNSALPIVLPSGQFYPERNIFVRGFRTIEQDPFVPASAEKFIDRPRPAVVGTSETFTLGPGESYKIVLDQLKWVSILDPDRLQSAGPGVRGDWYVRAIYLPTTAAGDREKSAPGILSQRLSVHLGGRD